MMNHDEHITKIIQLDLKFQCLGQDYAIIAKNVYLLKEL